MANDLGYNEARTREIQAVCSANSRVFYASDSSVYFSKVISGKMDRYKCLQENDPTDDEFYDLLDSDGGVVNIAGAGTIKAMIPFKLGIIVLSEEGCWYISGTNGIIATDLSVEKISEFGITYPKSVVNTGDAVLYFNRGGIIGIQANEYGELKASLLTNNTIRTYFIENWNGSDDIGEEFNIVSGKYDSRLNQVFWVHRTKFHGLILDLNTNGFYPQKFGLTNRPGIREYKILSILGSTSTFLGFRLITSRKLFNNNLVYTISGLTSTEFRDYNEPYEAYLEAGPESLGVFSNDKTVTSVSIAFQRTEKNITGFDTTTNSYKYDYPSSCILSSKVDTSGYTGYHSSPRQCYFLNQRGWIPQSGPYPIDITEQGDDIVYFKGKVRGEGKGVSFRFESEQGKDLQILGFSVEYSMRGRQR